MRSRSTSLALGCQQLVKEAAAVLSAPFTISTWGRELQTQPLPTEVSKQGGWTIPGAVYSSSLSQQPWQLHLWLCRAGWDDPPRLLAWHSLIPLHPQTCAAAGPGSLLTDGTSHTAQLCMENDKNPAWGPGWTLQWGGTRCYIPCSTLMGPEHHGG